MRHLKEFNLRRAPPCPHGQRPVWCQRGRQARAHGVPDHADWAGHPGRRFTAPSRGCTVAPAPHRADCRGRAVHCCQLPRPLRQDGAPQGSPLHAMSSAASSATLCSPGTARHRNRGTRDLGLLSPNPNFNHAFADYTRGRQVQRAGGAAGGQGGRGPVALPNPKPKLQHAVEQTTRAAARYNELGAPLAAKAAEGLSRLLAHLREEDERAAAAALEALKPVGVQARRAPARPEARLTVVTGSWPGSAHGISGGIPSAAPCLTTAAQARIIVQVSSTVFGGCGGVVIEARQRPPQSCASVCGSAPAEPWTGSRACALQAHAGRMCRHKRWSACG